VRFSWFYSFSPGKLWGMYKSRPRPPPYSQSITHNRPFMLCKKLGSLEASLHEWRDKYNHYILKVCRGGKGTSALDRGERSALLSGRFISQEGWTPELIWRRK
jgi:hypothetical protein